MTIRNQWPLRHHFLTTAILAATVALFWVTAMVFNSYREATETGPPKAQTPLEIVLDPPSSYSLLPIPMEGR